MPKRSSGQSPRVRRDGFDASSTGNWDYNTSTQNQHNPWGSAEDIKNQLGVSQEVAERLYGDVRAFTGTYSDDIREAQRGESDWGTAIRMGKSCEELIDRSPKWNGAELTRGIHGLDADTMKAMTTVGALVNCNYGSASWTTYQPKAESFAGHGARSLVMHVSGPRRATSINGISEYKDIEYEVLGSMREAFECVRTEMHGDTMHAYYKVIDFDYDWKYK